jgi:hypothetical protein
VAPVIDDGIRPPVPGDPTAAAYKEWLHLNVIDHESGCMALVNISIHGDPADPRSTAVGLALLHDGEEGWAGNVDVRSVSEARVGLSSIALPEVAMVVDTNSGTVSASAAMPQHRFVLELEAVAASRPYAFTAPARFGSGWISWYVVPRLSVRGRVVFNEREIRFEDAVGYHDHNWGRWHWGDDARWEWGAFLCGGEAGSFVFSRATTRDMRVVTTCVIIADTPAGRRVFGGGSIDVQYEGEIEASVRRLPGALAALHQDRVHPPLPGRVTLRAADGIDALTIEIDVTAAAQLITGDPAVVGYGFIHEITGSFTASGTVAGQTILGSGPAAFEYLL